MEDVKKILRFGFGAKLGEIELIFRKRAIPRVLFDNLTLLYGCEKPFEVGAKGEKFRIRRVELGETCWGFVGFKEAQNHSVFMAWSSKPTEEIIASGKQKVLEIVCGNIAVARPTEDAEEVEDVFFNFGDMEDVSLLKYSTRLAIKIIGFAEKMISSPHLQIHEEFWK